MVALGLDTPSQQDLDRLSADDDTVNKAVALLAKMENRGE